MMCIYCQDPANEYTDEDRTESVSVTDREDSKQRESESRLRSVLSTLRFE